MAFRFKDADTPLHGLDPRAKIALAGSLILFLWIRPDLRVLLLAIPPLLFLVNLGGLWRDLAGSARTYLILGIILLPLNALLYSVYAPGDAARVLVTLTPHETPLLGRLIITWGALELSVVVYIRLVLMLLTASVFIMTTSLDQVQALLLKLRFPSFFILTLGFAFRFIPTIAEEAQRIREAQMARGLELQRGWAIRRYWRAIVPLVMPLMVSALRRSLLFAEALEARATFAHPRRTWSIDLAFKPRDVAVALASAAFFGMSLFFLRLQPVF